jgi:hypothetical protein
LLQNLDNEQSKKKKTAAADCVSQSHPFFSTARPLVMALKKYQTSNDTKPTKYTSQAIYRIILRYTRWFKYDRD